MDDISEETARAMVLLAPLCGPAEAIAAFERGCALGERYAKPGAFTVALVPIADLATDLERLNQGNKATQLRRLAASARSDQRIELVASCVEIAIRLKRVSATA